MRGDPVTPMLKKFVFMRPMFIPLLGNFFLIYILLRHNLCLTLGGSLSLTWWCGCLPMMAMSLEGTNSFIFIV